MTDFRLCLTCMSYSQAGNCHYTQKLEISSSNLPLQISVTFLEIIAPIKLTFLNYRQQVNLVKCYKKSGLSFVSLQLASVKA